MKYTNLKPTPHRLAPYHRPWYRFHYERLWRAFVKARTPCIPARGVVAVYENQTPLVLCASHNRYYYIIRQTHYPPTPRSQPACDMLTPCVTISHTTCLHSLSLFVSNSTLFLLVLHRISLFTFLVCLSQSSTHPRPFSLNNPDTICLLPYFLKILVKYTYCLHLLTRTPSILFRVHLICL
jgi:hypothetical protein